MCNYNVLRTKDSRYNDPRYDDNSHYNDTFSVDQISHNSVAGTRYNFKLSLITIFFIYADGHCRYDENPLFWEGKGHQKAFTHIVKQS